MVTAGALERLREANRRAITGLLAGEGPMSRADLARGTGLSRTTVSSLVTDLIGSGDVVETDRPRPAAQGRQRAPAAPGRAEHPARRGRRRRHRPRARPGGGRRPQRRRARGGDRHRSTSTSTASTRWTGRPGWSATDSPPPASSATTCTPSGCACRRRWTGARRGSAPGSCRAGAHLSPGDELHRRLDVPVFADNDANLGALAELGHGAARGAHRRRSTSRSPAASAPASCSAAGCTAARPASPGRSATSRSARTARSAAAATAAASRPSSRRRG